MIWNVLVIVPAILLFLFGPGWWSLALLLSAHVPLLISTLWPACDWFGEVVYDFKTSGQTSDVWVTIDDGPDPEDTPRLLDLLDEFEAKATFFFIGEKSAAHPELVLETCKRGHQIGNHTMTHPQFWYWSYGPKRASQEIIQCQDVLTKITGIAPQWFRAPAGFKNVFVQESLERLRLRYACWSSRGLDGVINDKAKILPRLQKGIRPGAILLMHEGRIDADGKRLAPQVLQELLTQLKTRGYRCVIPEIPQ